MILSRICSVHEIALLGTLENALIGGRIVRGTCSTGEDERRNFGCSGGGCGDGFVITVHIVHRVIWVRLIDRAGVLRGWAGYRWAFASLKRTAVGFAGELVTIGTIVILRRGSLVRTVMVHQARRRIRIESNSIAREGGRGRSTTRHSGIRGSLANSSGDIRRHAAVRSGSRAVLPRVFGVHGLVCSNANFELVA